MLDFLKRIFHKHQWIIDNSEYIDKGLYHVSSHCKICNKNRSEYVRIH